MGGSYLYTNGVLIMSVKMRQRVERLIVRRFILDAKAKGYLFNVDNGGDEYELSEPTNNVPKVLAAMFATDDERLYVFEPKEDKPFAWVYLVYGNSGWDVVNDYTANLEDVMTGANELADKYS